MLNIGVCALEFLYYDFIFLLATYLTCVGLGNFGKLDMLTCLYKCNCIDDYFISCQRKISVEEQMHYNLQKMRQRQCMNEMCLFWKEYAPS